ncbi:MAG: endonuclease [Mariprofundus sp.]|nr:endonuclease [Mariprofundus sp.]
MQKIIIPIISILLLFMSITAHSASFSHAKKVLQNKVYQDHRETFYAGCRYSKKKRVNWKSCGYSPRKSSKRGKRIEWEHIVPAWAFGHQRQCWQHGGRRNCRKNDPVFKAMEADMMNLVPAIGELNGDRSNFRYGMIAGEHRAYGQVDFEVDFKLKRSEPRPEVRGDIARTYFYMQRTYGLRISSSQHKLFAAWKKQDPISAWEIERTRRISHLQKIIRPVAITEAVKNGRPSGLINNHSAPREQSPAG